MSMTNMKKIDRSDIQVDIHKNNDFHFDVSFSHNGNTIKRVAMHKDVYEKPLTKQNKHFFMQSIESDIVRYICNYNKNIDEMEVKENVN